MPIWSHMNRPATWNNGVVQPMTSSPASSKACAPRQEASARLRCETSTPLGSPVEPLEKVTAAGSSGATATGGSVSGCVADEGIERVRPFCAADRHDPLQRRGRRQQRARFGGIGGMDEQQFGADPGQHFGPAGGIGADRDMGERAAGPRRAEMDGRIIDIVGRQDRQPAARPGVDLAADLA